MPRCFSCGKFTKHPHREHDGRVEKAYCDFCHAERKWKLEGNLDDTDGLVKLESPPLNWWERLKQYLGL